MNDIILCDIDGTLARMNGRKPYEWHRVGEDTVHEAVAFAVQTFIASGTPVIFLSGRDAVCREQTVQWLKEHITYGAEPELYMRPAKDNRPDHVVKEELYREHIQPWHTVKFVLDDRNRVVKLWRSLGLVCFQVADGDF